MSFKLRVRSDGSYRIDLAGTPSPAEWAFLLRAIESYDSLLHGEEAPVVVEPEPQAPPRKVFRTP